MSKRPIAATEKPAFSIKPIPKGLSVPTPSTAAQKNDDKAPKPKKVPTKTQGRTTETKAKLEATPAPKKESSKRDTTITLTLERDLYDKVIDGAEKYDLSLESFATKKLHKLYRAFEDDPLVLQEAVDVNGQLEKLKIRVRYSVATLQAIKREWDPLELRSAADLLGSAFTQYLRRTL